MSYELWDVQTGNGLAQFGTARAMADFVDRLLDANGKSWAVHLSLVIEEATGDQSGLLTGSDLLAWTWGVLHASPEAIRIPAKTAPRSGGVAKQRVRPALVRTSGPAR